MVVFVFLHISISALIVWPQAAGSAPAQLAGLWQVPLLTVLAKLALLFSRTVSVSSACALATALAVTHEVDGFACKQDRSHGTR